MYLTGNQVRQSFLDFFAQRGHTIVPSASLVPGGDSTLLFTNAGMVQFKDVFLGTETRPYTRAVDSQKCLRVSGKHNDLDTVGRDNTHHTFFEMLGNWSFGDYYKKEALGWSWELLTKTWKLDPSRLYATYFVDDQADLPADDEARDVWLAQPGFNPDHLVIGGRKDNFWEMAETGPCGPSSEIHYDFGASACNMKSVPGHICAVNGDCSRIVEIWNNVFIQYNRTSPTNFQPLPKRHVDTGMGFERIVSIIQGVSGNYETDLLKPLLDETQHLAGQTDLERQENLTAYRVISDHVRAAAFLIADGVIPGNAGRNYVCRMIIRRAARFARTINLNEPFMAKIAAKVIENYQQAYPELNTNRELIDDTLTSEEKRFAETLDSGFAMLQTYIEELKEKGQTTLNGKQAFELYATLGFPVEITRDILAESDLSVDEPGFYDAMEAHRQASGKGSAFADMNGNRTEFFANLLRDLQAQRKLPAEGAVYDPYTSFSSAAKLVAILRDGELMQSAQAGDEVELIVTRSPLYLESGGQIGDIGEVISSDGGWKVDIERTFKPVTGLIVLAGKVAEGKPQTDDAALVKVDLRSRRGTMRNHTGTHLLHAALREVLGEKVHQAGSVVDPERMRFDFNYPHAVSKTDLLKIEERVNELIAAAIPVSKEIKSLDQAKAEGVTALFGEKYGSTVRTIKIADERGRVSYELCGGTHVDNTAEIGSFYILSESSVAAGMRRIEAVTGLGAYHFAREQVSHLNQVATFLQSSPADTLNKLEALEAELKRTQRELEQARTLVANQAFTQKLGDIREVEGIPVLSAIIPNTDIDALRSLADQFRQKHPTGVVVLGTVVNEKPALIAAVTPDLIKRGLKAGDLVKRVALVVGGGGGGRPDMAQAGGKDPSKLPEALAQIDAYIKENLK
ncbi:MAG: alanine--tRNA ligase [Anaerolineaceae bacterium]|nr:alanine--tRNA ligase [Anaerolineaceae bacterium]MDD4042989.1 alanine--tRNA ligase [Anaerolineaceae bacterium]